MRFARLWRMTTPARAKRKRLGRPAGSPPNREAILAAARHQFAERGYESATIRGIAAAADVDPALVGLAMTRFVIRIDPIVGTDSETLVACYAPVVRHLLTGPLPPDGGLLTKA